ncbi:hypothetical protein Vadar_020853 [Vaccinium darrowii]|uniref:Uncharacterized protein n=1 Tax=Vaccinium darrowii TaxID=229202 RepID=A0ACB7YPK9_9ERIC|nr:hypothetical protein Vadar_020853 [Vaccinium darrowii]
MTSSSGKRPLPKLSDYPPDYKCRKVNRQFPSYLGDRAPQVDARSTGTEVGEEGNTKPVGNSKNSEPSDMEREITKPMMSNANVEALRQWETVDNDVEVLVKTPDQPKPIDVQANMTKAEPVTTLDISKLSSHTLPGVCKYPPQKIGKGVSACREIPSCFGKRNVTLDSDKVLGYKRGVEQMKVVDSKRTDWVRKEVPIQDWYDFEKQLGGTSLRQMVDKVRIRSLQLSHCGTDTKGIGGKTTENEVIQDDAVLLQSPDITKSSREKGSEIPILVGKKPNDVKVQEDVSPSIVRDVLNLFKEKFRMLSNENKAQPKEQRKASCQLYEEAAMLLKKQQKWVNTEKLIGPVPGIEIGDRFQFRAELVVVGLHRKLRNGIDYMEVNGKKIATSIVKSGRYGDNGAKLPKKIGAESYDHLIYCGPGGNPNIINKPPEDQKLVRGNLALKNSMEDEIPIRVILKTTKGSQKSLTYYGLYMVTKCRQERGNYGKFVYEFDLDRLAGQPKVNGGNVGMPKKSKVLKKSQRLATDDTSQGKEVKPVRAVNILEGCSRKQK